MLTFSFPKGNGHGTGKKNHKCLKDFCKDFNLLGFKVMPNDWDINSNEKIIMRKFFII